MNTFATHRYFLLTVDPVHIGTGGTRLGRVDMSIVREPGTRLPKIPGTSLSGAIRAYAAYRYGKRQCAGQGQSQGSKHCGQPTCPICYTFGTASESGKSYAGVVSIGDARILLFPVYSMVGPVWVTSPSALYDAGFGKEHEGVLKPFEVDKNEQGFARWNFSSPDHINLGWLMVKKENGLPKGLATPNQSEQDKLPTQIPEQIRERIVLVSDRLFSQIVNSNLEVRTSVSINPETGAAEDGALFTYEAIPRATVLWMDVVVDDYRGEFPDKRRWETICSNDVQNLPDEMPDLEVEAEQKLRELGYIVGRPEKRKDENNEEFSRRKREYWERVKSSWKACQYALKNLDWSSPIDMVTLGLEWAEHLGIGGMGTRGFGRVRSLAQCEVQNQKAQNCQSKNGSNTSGKVEENHA